jgi:hypothetical protein
MCQGIGLWHDMASFKARTKVGELFLKFCKRNQFFLHEFFCLLIENNDVNVLDKFVLIVSVFNDEVN